MNNDKFTYQNVNEFQLLKSVCEVCINYNDGKGNEKCPAGLVNKVINEKKNVQTLKWKTLLLNLNRTIRLQK